LGQVNLEPLYRGAEEGFLLRDRTLAKEGLEVIHIYP